MANEEVSNEISHLFSPIIPDKYFDLYKQIVNKLNNLFPGYRKKVLKEEIDKIQGDESDLDYLKFKSELLILNDLMNQGYNFSKDEDNNVILTLTQEDAESKDFIRTNMSFEKKTQLGSDSTRAFVDKMEKTKKYNDEVISIRNLIGDPQVILEGYKSGSNSIIKPYIQLADNSRDIHSGYLLKDIWRYFRFTWAIPYKNTPGRNLYYLVRDAAQKFHPIIGIFALGNCILNLTVRDDEIGWTIDSLKRNLERKKRTFEIERPLKNKKISTINRVEYLETEIDYKKRILDYSNVMLPVFIKSIDKAISEVYKKDIPNISFESMTQKDILELRNCANELKNSLLNTPHLNEKNVDYEKEALSPLYKKKRLVELAKLYEAKSIFEKYSNNNSYKCLSSMLKSEDGKKALNTAIVANRKTKIGSSMMEIIVCGAIPPYNEVLGGKLVSMLACSPKVAFDYKNRYSNQVSEIASRMAGRRIVRDSSLVFLGTTSLYTKCSSQYNRISIPDEKGNTILNYHKVGITEGFGSLFFSKETTDCILKMQILIDGGRRINNVFGEGTSPRFRLLTTGFSQLGLKADVFLKHNSPRIVYMMNLAKNTYEYLNGIDDKLEYFYDYNNEADVNFWTKYFIDFWYNRWFTMRLSNEEIRQRLNSFDVNKLLISNNR